MTVPATTTREYLERAIDADVPSVVTDHTRGYTVALITREAAYAAASAILAAFGDDPESGVELVVRVAELATDDRRREVGAAWRVVVRWDR